MSQNIIGTSSRLYQKTQKSTRTFSLSWPIMGKWFLGLAILGCFMLIILLAAL
jgi:hypothetical protein